MKKVLAYLIVPVCITLVLISVLSACEKTGCKNTFCGTHQVCYNGTCYCENGREGSDCNTMSIDRYIGNYTVNEITYTGVSPTPTYYTANIVAGSVQDRIYIYNFGFCGSGNFIVARINTSTNTLKGTHITINSADNYGASIEVNGEGDYIEATNRIVWEGTIKTGFDTRQCQVTLYKQ
jgi:hypothetical protein